MYAFKIGFLEITWVDAIDIFLVTFLLSQVYKMMRGSMAIRVFLGFLSLYLIYLIVKAAEMELLTNILGQFMGVGVIAAIIIFQQEIRKFLLFVGRSASLKEGKFVTSIRGLLNPAKNINTNINPITEAVKSLAASKTGALMVLSKNSELKFYVESGDRINGLLSKRLLMSIFYKNSPLHDGAVIILNGKILAARCILPVTERDNLPGNYGLRHRAAIGMTEITDTLVIVVSEETGQVSCVQNGEIFNNLSSKELRTFINEYFYLSTQSFNTIAKIFKRKKEVDKKLQSDTI